MFNAETVQQLKQVNISKDTEKTCERTSALWKSASKPEREEILELAGLKIFSVQRAYRTGKISAKLVVSIAQVLNINPYYLTGESDDKDGNVNELLQQLLITLNYNELVAAVIKNERKEAQKLAKLAAQEQESTDNEIGIDADNEEAPEDKTSSEGEKEPSAETKEEIAERFEDEMRAALFAEAERYKAEKDEASSNIAPEMILSPEQNDFLDSLTEEDMQTLMRAIVLKAKFGGKNVELLLKLKTLLVS